MGLKFIKLFEDYEKDLRIERAETAHTWSDVRDAIQMKRPFMIVVFKDQESYEEALREYFDQFEYIKQTAYFDNSGEIISYPSIFFVIDSDRDFKNEILKIYEKYNIKQIILGEAGFEYASLYLEDGTASEFGNEIVSTLEQNDFKGDDYFKIGATYYRFIDFVD